MKKLFALLLAASAYLSTPAQAANAPLNCTIRTWGGYYLTAVGGGRRITDVIHTNKRTVGPWERFVFVDADRGTPIVTYGIRTYTGNYLTVVGGGGRITDVIHSDAPWLRAWEYIQTVSLGGGWYALRTNLGYFLTAVGGGGRVTDTIHSDARRIGNWEKFYLNCWH